MAASEIRAGRAYVEATIKDNTAAGLSKIEARLKSVGGKISDIGGKMMAAGVAMTAAFVPAIKAASDLNEISSKFEVVFGSGSAAATKWADDFAGQVGRSKQVVYDFMAGAQNLFVPIGFDRAGAAELSKTVTKLAIDLASFGNTSDEDALAAIKSGLLGEAEPMKKFGVIVNETATSMELLNQKIDPTEATDAQKTYARLAIMLRATKDAQGDAVRTSSSFANTLKRLQGEALDAAAALGTAVLPMVTQWVSTAAAAAVAAGKWASENGPLLSIMLKVGAALIAIGGTAFVFGKIASTAAALIPVMRGVATAIGIVRIASLALLATPWGIALVALAAIVGSVTYAYLKNAKGVGEMADAQEKALSTAEEARKTDQAALERLQQLGNQQALNGDQQAEAAKLAAQLKDKYGELGVTYDSVTKKVIVAADAQAKLNQQMAAAAETELRNAIREKDRNIEEQKKNGGAGVGSYIMDMLTLGEGGFAADKNQKQADAIADQIKQRDALQRQLNALRGGNSAAAFGSVDGKKDDASAIQKRIADAKEVAKAEQDIAKDAAEAKKQAAENVELSATTAVNQRYDAELAKIKAVQTFDKGAEANKQAVITALEAKRQAELTAITKKGIDDKLAAELEAIDLKYKAEEDRLKKLGIDPSKLNPLRDGEKTTAITKANADRAKAAQDAANATADAQADEKARQQAIADQKREQLQAELELRKQVAEAEADVMEKNGNKTGADKKRLDALKIQQQIDRDNAEQQAKALGLNDDQKKMRAMLDQLQASQTKAAQPEKVFGVAGTFNAYAAQSLRGNGGTAAERTAKAAEATQKTNAVVAKNTTELVKKGGQTYR